MNPDEVSIPEFFASKDIFVTGATGFMGQVLVEKLIRSCPDINKIFILLRTKRGKSLTDRLELLKNLPLFSVIHEKFPERLTKLIPIEGDGSLLKMGVSDKNFEKMKNVSIIFHVAANVRFDDPLKDAIFLNTRGTLEVLKFAETLKDLKVVVHVSTAYSNIKTNVVKEEIYPPLADWRSAIKISEQLDSDALNSVTPHFTSFMPNTYTFTKHLAEQVISEYSAKLPIVIFRPSVVLPTLKDPFPGWTYTFNGPLGVLLSGAMGILKTGFADPDTVLNYIPVDVAIKSMIVGAWLKGKEPHSGSLPIYNCSSYNIWQANYEFIFKFGEEMIKELPINQMLWIPSGCTTKNRVKHLSKLWFLQVIPAIILDWILQIQGRKPFFLKVQRRLLTELTALQPFTLNAWDVLNEKFVSLHDDIKDEDVEHFGYMDFAKVNFKDAFKLFYRGAVKYLLKEDGVDIDKLKIKYNRLKKIDMLIKFLLILIFVYFFFVFLV